jgi:hypothetical protein
MSEPTTEGFELLRSLITRVDNLMNAIMTVKDEMYKESQWTTDEKRIYDSLEKVQESVMSALKEATLIIDGRLNTVVSRQNTMEKRLVPGWVFWLVATSIGAFISYGVQTVVHLVWAHVAPMHSGF